MAVVLGGVYAHWDDAVKINGSVSTGVFNLQLSVEDCWDIEDQQHILDVGHVSAELRDENDGDDVFDGGIHDKIWVNITNMYPDYEAWIDINLENVGTIPAEIAAGLASDVGEEDTYYFIEIYETNTNSMIYSWNGDGLGGGEEYINTTWGHMEGDRFVFNDMLVPEEVWYITIHIGMISEPNPPEELMDQEYHFELEITGTQAVPEMP